MCARVCGHACMCYNILSQGSTPIPSLRLQAWEKSRTWKHICFLISWFVGDVSWVSMASLSLA
eukprot:c39909_g1_i1 orf=146-334(+)